MTRQTTVLDCKPVDIYLALAHIENNLARAWLEEFYGRKNIPMDPSATLSEHHVPISNDGYVTQDRIIFDNSFRARYFSSAQDKIPTLHISRYDDHSSGQYMALNTSLIILPNMHGYAFKPQAEAKEVNARQAALFASSTQLQALLLATMRTSQRDAPRRCEQKNQHVQYEQQGWQDASGSDKRFRSHCKQDAKDNTQLVDGDDTVFIRLVDSPTRLAEPQASHMNGW